MRRYTGMRRYTAFDFPQFRRVVELSREAAGDRKRGMTAGLGPPRSSKFFITEKRRRATGGPQELERLVPAGERTDRSLGNGAAVEPTAPTPVALRGPPSFLRVRILAVSQGVRSVRSMPPDRANRGHHRPAGSAPLPRYPASDGAATAIPAGGLWRPSDMSPAESFAISAADAHPSQSGQAGHPVRGDWPPYGPKCGKSSGHAPVH